MEPECFSSRREETLNMLSAVACGHHLHTPMFFFLLNLALADLDSICTTVPHSISSPSLDLVVSVLYSVMPPALNPLIYSLRNQELKAEEAVKCLNDLSMVP
ncbi:olfactory receptor 2AK2-like [Agelaius phoeniceus]|uniref:olfactory receptor 2AK2-like n=1 Tax=Agelaius phoeniceus TaxID=39638 RepID=UPI0040551392